MHIFSNLATSLDGKIATASRSHFPLGTPEDRRMMQVIRKKSDAILMGASSLRAFKGPLVVADWIGTSKRQPLNIIVSSNLDKISPRWRFFTEQSISRLIFVNRGTPPATLKKFEASCKISFIDPQKSIATQIISVLKELGVKQLLVEGGGAMMWDFVKENLIDEYHVTVTPRILGGKSAPTLVDGRGFLPREIVNLKLARCRKVGDELYLIYRKTSRRG